VVEHGRTGYLVPPHRADGFTDAVASLAADAGRRHAFGAAGRAAVQGRSWSSIGDELLGHYRQTLAAPVVIRLPAASLPAAGRP
jgi:phosphatidylinositol alpha 1,6-mannosyltransferase